MGVGCEAETGAGGGASSQKMPATNRQSGRMSQSGRRGRDKQSSKLDFMSAGIIKDTTGP